MNNMQFEDPDEPQDDSGDDDVPNEQDSPSSGQNVRARVVSILNCVAAQIGEDSSRRMLLLSVGAADGSVEQLAIQTGDGEKLVALLQSALPRDARVSRGKQKEVPFGACRRPRRRRTRPGDIFRAEYRMENENPPWVLDRLKRADPCLADYVKAHLDALSSSLLRNCRTKATAKIIAGRLTRAMLTSVNVARRSS